VHFAGEVQGTNAANMCEVTGDDKRLMLLISLVRQCRTAAWDEVVTMFCRSTALPSLH
jgi:hypothetical protein